MSFWRELRQAGINTDKKVYVIAEAGINHGGDIDTAKKIIESAARTGCDAVKFQTYITEKRVPADSPIFNILKQCELPFDAFAQLKKTAESCNLDFMSTPFDVESLDCLCSIGCDTHKIASFDVTNFGFLEQIAQKAKSVIMSTGMANADEIQKAVNTLESGDCKVSLLHCISSYPLDEKDANLAAISILREQFSNVIGFSDHSPGLKVSELSVAAGAQIIERHYKITDDCVDAPVSISEKDMKDLVGQIRVLEAVLGDGVLGISKAQEGTVVFRRT